MPAAPQPAGADIKGKGKMDEVQGLDTGGTSPAKNFDQEFPALPTRTPPAPKEYIAVTPLPGSRPSGVVHYGQNGINMGANGQGIERAQSSNVTGQALTQIQ
ncbi:hypothetical protein K7X08_022578 [Anisodus acutangulus]|uniref:Uncharacterized protein n=1 Tax=Anisodus acutangulus TaxID=402998 RepID=A0A9Q1MLF1_9SOLA|nr:hypothetical protein K7X08_022578 [Anisodus acutangulus]